MSTTILPSLSVVGGCVTQQVLKSMYNEPRDVSVNSINQRHVLKNSFSIQNSGNNENRQANNEFIKDVSRQRCSFFHNLCSNVLEAGFHLTFRELFNLVKQTEEEATDESFKQIDSIQLKEDEEKLSFLNDELVKAERAKRKGQIEQVYDAQHALATYFDEKRDFLLADHFYLSAYNTSRQIRTDGGRKEAEANCNLGTVAERKKLFQEAIKLHEKFYFLCKDKQWKRSDGVLLYHTACYHLHNAHVSFSEQLPVDQKENILQHLHRAHQLAKEGGDKKEIGQIGYFIGNKYDFFGEHETAVKYHTEYYDLCEAIDNDAGIGKACRALALANRRQGNFTQAVKYLQEFLKVAEKSRDVDEQSNACSDLGAVYNLMGKYEQSANFYKRSYELLQQAKQIEQLNYSGCEYAIALAHGLFTGKADNISRNSKDSLESLLNWKSERLQSFSNDQHTFSMFVSLQKRQEEKRVMDERKKSKQYENKIDLKEEQPKQVKLPDE